MRRVGPPSGNGVRDAYDGGVDAPKIAGAAVSAVPFDIEELRSAVPSLGETAPRQFALTAHRLLRELILQRRIPPHAVLKQAEVARVLGASRTPIREAFRMLQEEGLILTEPNQRAVVVGFDIADLDAAYASRILLESLAAGITALAITAPAIAKAEIALSTMRSLQDQHQTSKAWGAAHAEFHRLVTSGASTQLLKEVARLQERTWHYVRLAQLGDNDQAVSASRMHRAILAAMRRHSQENAVRATARHLAMTAEHITSQIDPRQQLPAISTALLMLSQSDDGRH